MHREDSSMLSRIIVVYIKTNRNKKNPENPLKRKIGEKRGKFVEVLAEFVVSLNYDIYITVK